MGHMYLGRHCLILNQLLLSSFNYALSTQDTLIQILHTIHNKKFNLVFNQIFMKFILGYIDHHTHVVDEYVHPNN